MLCMAGGRVVVREKLLSWSFISARTSLNVFSMVLKGPPSTFCCCIADIQLIWRTCLIQQQISFRARHSCSRLYKVMLADRIHPGRYYIGNNCCRECTHELLRMLLTATVILAVEECKPLQPHFLLDSSRRSDCARPVTLLPSCSVSSRSMHIVNTEGPVWLQLR